MFNKKEGLTAIILGLMFGTITFVILKIIRTISFKETLIFLIFAFVFFAVFMFIYLIIHNKRMKKRYVEIEKKILTPIFLKINGNFYGEKKIINGNIYFCEAGIVFASFDEKPYRLQELLLQDILKYEIDYNHLNIYTKNNQVFIITTSDAPKVIETLKIKGWISD